MPKIPKTEQLRKVAPEILARWQDAAPATGWPPSWGSQEDIANDLLRMFQESDPYFLQELGNARAYFNHKEYRKRNPYSVSTGFPELPWGSHREELSSNRIRDQTTWPGNSLTGPALDAEGMSAGYPESRQPGPELPQDSVDRLKFLLDKLSRREYYGK